MRYPRHAMSAALVSALCLASGTALAATAGAPGWYVGGSVGEGQVDYSGGVGRSTDAFGIHGGYRFNRHFSIEAEYADMGSVGFSYDCPAVCAPEAYPLRVRQEFSRADVAAIATLPLSDRFEAFAKLGYGRVRLEQTMRPGILPVVRGGTTSSEAVYGLGLRWHFESPWSLQLQWERTEASAVDIDLDMVSLGMEYRFRPGA